MHRMFSHSWDFQLCCLLFSKNMNVLNKRLSPSSQISLCTTFFLRQYHFFLSFRVNIQALLRLHQMAYICVQFPENPSSKVHILSHVSKLQFPTPNFYLILLIQHFSATFIKSALNSALIRHCFQPELVISWQSARLDICSIYEIGSFSHL